MSSDFKIKFIQTSIKARTPQSRQGPVVNPAPKTAQRVKHLRMDGTGRLSPAFLLGWRFLGRCAVRTVSFREGTPISSPFMD